MTKIHIVKGDIDPVPGQAIVETNYEDPFGGDVAVGCAKLVLDSDVFKKHVIKTIVPKWHGGQSREYEMLARSQIACLDKASEAGVSDVSFPVLSKNYGDYPRGGASEVAISATALWIDHFGDTSSLKNVHFVCDDDHTRQNLEDALDNTGLSA